MIRPLPISLLSALLLGTTQAQNDECAGAIPLAIGTTVVNTVGSTTSLPPWPCAAGGRDIWYVFTAPNTTTYTFDTCSGASYDTALQIFGGSCAQLMSLACNDDTCGLRSMVSISGTAGTDYFLRVGGYSGDQGTATLVVFEVPPPGPGPIGTNPSLCDPGVANSTGAAAEISGFGQDIATEQDVRLSVDNIPAGEFGIFIASRTLGNVPHPGGSTGTLCVLGNIARYYETSQIFQGAGLGVPVPAGGLQVGDIPVPTNPAPGETILAGDTWYWQTWYRDTGGTTSNFSNVLEIRFQ